MFLVLFCSTTVSAQWNALETDIAGDGSYPNLLDGISFEYMHDVETDSLWFRVTVAELNEEQSTNVGVNIMVWFPTPAADESLFNFWSAGNGIAWHRLLTAWVTGTAPNNYTGTMGISKGAGVNNSDFTGVVDDLSIQVNMDDNTIIIGMNRTDLIPDDQLGQAVEIASAVGSSMSWNDDILTSTAAPIIALDTTTATMTSVLPLVTSDEVNAFPNPANNTITIESSSELEISNLEFYDMAGKLVMTTIAKENTNIDISKMSSGTYLIRAYSDDTYIGGTKLIKTLRK